MVPRDKIQGAALATIMKDDGCKTVDIWNDKTTYGAGLAKNVELSVKEQGLQVGSKSGTDRNSPNYKSQASNAKGDCFIWGGVTGENGVQVYKDVAASNPSAKLYGPDGVAEEAFTNPKKGGVPAAVGARLKITVATLGVKDLPSATEVLDEFKRSTRCRPSTRMASTDMRRWRWPLTCSSAPVPRPATAQRSSRSSSTQRAARA